MINFSESHLNKETCSSFVFPENEKSNELSEQDFRSELTDPNMHDPKNFCYIVHSPNTYSSPWWVSKLKERGKYDASQRFDLLSAPTDIAKKKLISTSIINQSHTYTFGNSFFILDVPWDNFVSMTPKDGGTDLSNPDLILQKSKHPNLKPSELIAKTGDHLNEVVVTGAKVGNEVKITGVGIVMFDTGIKKIEPKESARMREIATDLGVPVIEFIEPQKIKDTEPEVHTNFVDDSIELITVSRNGFTYKFEVAPQGVAVDVSKSDYNWPKGKNPVSQEEWFYLKPIIVNTIQSDKQFESGKKEFFNKMDEYFDRGDIKTQTRAGPVYS